MRPPSRFISARAPLYLLAFSRGGPRARCPGRSEQLSPAFPLSARRLRAPGMSLSLTPCSLSPYSLCICIGPADALSVSLFRGPRLSLPILPVPHYIVVPVPLSSRRSEQTLACCPLFLSFPPFCYVVAAFIGRPISSTSLPATYVILLDHTRGSTSPRLPFRRASSFWPEIRDGSNLNARETQKRVTVSSLFKEKGGLQVKTISLLGNYLAFTI